MARVALFAILSARQPLTRVKAMMDDIDGGEGDPWLYGWKASAWEEAWEDRRDRFERMQNIRRTNARRVRKMADNMLAQVLTWRGLGLAKGGFFLQMCFGVSGCMDSRNLELFGMPDRAFRSATLTYSSLSNRQKKVRSYHDFIRRLGGTAALWDIWCKLYAEQRGNDINGLLSAWAVSAHHCEILGIDPGDPPDEEDIPYDF